MPPRKKNEQAALPVAQFLVKLLVEVLDLNGLPVAFVELKKTSDNSDGLKYARNQLATYAEELPLAFRCNVACVVTDGSDALCGTAFTPFEHFAPWNADDGGVPVKQPADGVESLPVVLLINGLFYPNDSWHCSPAM